MATNPEKLQAVPRIEASDDGIRIHWDDECSNFYHYFWLRSACHCELCGDSLTGHRRLHPSDVPLDIEPLNLDAGLDRLRLTWPPDNHESLYDYDWLRDFAYDDSTRDWHPQLWDASLSLDEVSHRLNEIRANKSAELNFMRSLRDYGIAIVRSDERIGIESMAGLIGKLAAAAYNPIFELKPQQRAHTLGNSKQVVPPHTDESYLHTPTGILVLYCINPAQDGGESTLVDGFQVATRLREQDPDAFDVLCRVPQANHRIVPDEGLDHRTRNRALNIDERGNLVGFRFHPRSMAPMDVGSDLAKQLHNANSQLCQLMFDERNQLSFQLEAGDAVFFDNHRVMHARQAFTDPNRHLQICNVSREEFHQKLRLTLREQGFESELRQKWPAGVSG